MRSIVSQRHRSPDRVSLGAWRGKIPRPKPKIALAAFRPGRPPSNVLTKMPGQVFGYEFLAVNR